MQPQYGFRNHRLNEIESAPAIVKVKIDKDSVEIIVNELEKLDLKFPELDQKHTDALKECKKQLLEE